MQIQSINQNYTNIKVSNQVFKEAPSILSENSDYAISKNYSEISKSYAITSPNFYTANIKSTKVKLSLTDEKINPHFSVKLSSNKPIAHKPGLYSIYKMALNDQMHAEMNNSDSLSTKGSFIKPDSRKINIDCTQDDLVKTLKMINNKFVNLNIDKKYFDEAKQIAPAAYLLYLKTNYEPEDYQDVPVGMSAEDYEKLISNLTYDDMVHYNEELLNNSNINIELKVNKEFYNQNENEILKHLNNIKGLKNKD